MHLKVKKNKRSAGRIKLIFKDHQWIVDVPDRSKFKDMKGKTDTEMRKYLVEQGYSYTVVYR